MVPHSSNKPTTPRRTSAGRRHLSLHMAVPVFPLRPSSISMGVPTISEHRPLFLAWHSHASPSVPRSRKRRHVHFLVDDDGTVQKRDRVRSFSKRFFSVFDSISYGARSSLPRRTYYQCCTVGNAMRTRPSERTKNGGRGGGKVRSTTLHAPWIYTFHVPPTIDYSTRRQTNQHQLLKLYPAVRGV
jgi:hypothetical protein